MGTLRWLIALGVVLLSSVAFAQLAQQDYGWDIYGDRYPLFQRPYSNVSNFFVLEGPGNLNPGNLYDMHQDSTALRIPSELKAYIARQFKYVLFDQDSFCDRADTNEPATSMITPLYHQEAEALMNLSPEIIVFPYFTFTTMRAAYPWRSGVQEQWFLHGAGQSADSVNRIRAAEEGVYLMDVRNEAWKEYYLDSITAKVHSTTPNYRGVYLDNMTRYPYVRYEDYERLPAGVFDNWLGYLISFCQDLTALLPGVKVVCNSLGIDSLGAPRLLWGPNHGIDLMPYVSGGALVESFHGTAWRTVLDTTLAIMKYMKDNSKIFLAATHYHRGQDDDQVSEDILPNRFGLEPATGWLSSDTTNWPPLETFYRMQMSYLARYLLVSSGLQPFGYSFQPGVLRYQTIPYYKPWDESIGTPVDQDYVNAGNYYKREFGNALTIVNTTDNMNIITIPSASWYWYPYPNWDSTSGNNISAEKYLSNTVTLNKREGIVLFKKVTVDQKLEDETTSVGTVGRWETNHFVEYNVPKDFTFEVGTNEVLRGMRSVSQTQSAQKYNKWDLDQNVVNHRLFAITSEVRKLISAFKSINSSVVIRNELIDGPSVNGGNVQLKDPWLVDTTDAAFYQSPYGYRNLGMNVPYKPEQSPFNPNTNSNPTVPGAKYKGVFLGQEIAPGFPYYSVGVQTSQTIGGILSHFVRWSAHPDSALLRTPDKDTSAVVFKLGGATITALYKAPLRSSFTAASGPNSQRKVAMRGDVAHAVYTSGGIIWYSRYADETWSGEIPLSSTSVVARNPSVAAKVQSPEDHVYVVWEERYLTDTTRSQVLCRYSVNSGTSWSETLVIDAEAASPSTPTVGGGFTPIIVWKDFDGTLKMRIEPYRTPSWQVWTVVGADTTSRGFSVGETLFDGHHISYVRGPANDGDVWVTRFVVIPAYQPDPNSWRVTCLSSGYPWMSQCGGTSIAADGGGDQVWVAWDAKGMGEMDPEEASGVERRVFFKGRQGGHWLPMSYLEYTRYSMYPVLGIDSSFYAGTSELRVLWQDYYTNAVEHTRGIYGFTVLGPGRSPTRVDFSLDQQPWRMWTGLTGPPYAITLDQPLGPIYEGAGTENRIPTRVARVGCVQLDSISFGSLGRGAVSGELMIRLGNLTLKRGSVSTPIEFSTYDGIFEDWLGSTRFTVPLAGDSLLLRVGLDVRGFVINDSRLPLSTPILATMISDSSGPVSSKVLRINDLVHGNKLDTICYFRLAFPLSALRGKQIRLKQRLIGQAEGYSPAWAEWIRAVATDSGSSGSEGDPVLKVEESGVPMELALHAAFPNPFNPSTELRFDLPEPATISLIIYDLLGRKVAELANGSYEAGYQSAKWNGSDYASGVYLARFNVINQLGNVVYTKTNKLVLMK